MKIQIRGGSIPAGVGVSTSYADMLAQSLKEHDIELINTSRTGDTSFEGNWTYDEDINPVHPDILILHFGIDDIYRPVYRSEFKENLVQLVRLSRRRFNPDIFLLTSQPFSNPYDMDAAMIYYRAVREVAYDLRCRYVPLHFIIDQYVQEHGISLSDLVQDDDRYPNEKGHEIMHDILYRRIIDHLQG